jgi:hypothetical protein
MTVARIATSCVFAKLKVFEVSRDAISLIILLLEYSYDNEVHMSLHGSIHVLWIRAC